MKSNIQFRAEFFEEDGQVVGLVPDLNVSSFGDNLKEARVSLNEALTLFLEECERMGTLEEVLEESGYQKQSDNGSVRWQAREPVFVGKENLAVVIN
jgi:predicted RNase H-like HicB family nuclease